MYWYFRVFFSEELMVGTLLSFLFFLVADSVKWYNCFSYSISNSCLDVKITWFVNNANCVAKSRLVNLTMSEKRDNARLGMKGKSITLIQKRVCKITRDSQIYTLHLMLMWFKKKLILKTMGFQFLGNVLDYHISLSNPYPEDRNFNFELSDKKRFKSICVCCSPRPACSQSQPSFWTVVWKTFKLDATFVSDLHSGSEKQAYLVPYIWRGVLTLSLGIIFFTFHLELFHWIVY